MKSWYAQWRGPLFTGAIVVAIASVLTLMTTVGTIAVNRHSDNQPKAAAQAKAAAKTEVTPTPSRTTTQRGDGGDICNGFGNYTEAKRYYDAHPKDRKALSWDGDDRPCEDFIAGWARRTKR